MSRQRRSPDLESLEVTVSPELSAPVGAEIELVYQTFGSPEDEPLLLVMGLGGPMTWWNPDLCRLLARQGFYVIRYDNRDTGRSSRGTGQVSRSMLVRAFAGARVAAPYAISHLAEDGFGLLDHLGIESAHVCGVSMGGMIVQTMAIQRPERVRSLVSIMSTTGRRSVGWQSPRLIPTLLAPRHGGRQEYVDSSAAAWHLIGSPAYPEAPEDTRARAAETWDRGISGAGVLRQMLAVVTQPDRTKALGRLELPATVVHGMSDRMVHVSGGRATARAIRGSQLLLIPGMGHDLPVPLHDTFAGTIRRTADRV